ncbi:MAG TPA: GDSL-type esterase/lipase family protein [Candidatus Saccharimonadales bacterium]|nr:GDSL-type esterase/lipase family protein [Candidatus Saccharimonadales bacterium]
MRKNTRTPVMLAVVSLLASLVVFVSSGTATAAENVPELQWPAVDLHPSANLISGPQGNLTEACGARDLTTYGTSGNVVQQLDRTTRVNDVLNCIYTPKVDKNGDIYGALLGNKSNGAPGLGPIVAFSGNTLKWSYVTGCDMSTGPYMAQPNVGADGNIYVIDSRKHLLGFEPDAQASTTEPTKVLDVLVDGTCGDKLYPYKDGIVIYHVQDYSVHYYSYGGKDLGAPSGTDYRTGDPVINAEGQLFYRTKVGGDPQNSVIWKYDPKMGGAVWSTPVPTPNSVYGAGPYNALPGGGVLIRANERELDSNGNPISPAAYVTVLVTLDSDGRVVHRMPLPNKNGDGDLYDGDSFAVDVHGKVALARVLKQTLSDSSGWVPATEITVFDAASGNITYQGTMSGNTTQGEDNYGYQAYLASSGGSNTLGLNTLNVIARQCDRSGSCPQSKLYPIKVTGLGLDYPRGAVLTANTGPKPAPVPYVAMGDSFSSGEGVEPFDASSNTDTNKCHRSRYAYSRLLSRQPDVAASLNLGKFVACAGAKAKHISGQWSSTDTDNHVNLDEAPQIDALSSATRVVSLTLGGNDVKFADFVKACIMPLDSCAIGSDAYNASLDELNNNLHDKLAAAYEQILTAAPNADVYVLGYPQVVADKGFDDPNDNRCFYLHDAFGPDHWTDIRGARDIVDKLDTKILATVGDVQNMNADYNSRLHYVTLDGDESPFIGHEVCGTGESWFQNVNQATNDPAYVFHPNSLGQSEYAQMLYDAMNPL